MRYYNVNDVMEITGTAQNKSYEIIRSLQKTFKKRYPNAVFIQGKIPKWYFEEAMGFGTQLEGNEKNGKENQIEAMA